ncbi:c-type cytochrome [Paraburkholderia edwinii]|jgi:cytochrome c553|uniref:C-type cytochrome n=1 Tax=Paraburkholderia edwinii TaxID=2861782 RepID=A0ABX8UJC6_9BURK|nr:c-type cytochrome [Paraburkholderia edwinii]QYD68671.1 c-type cytochrome [Paraburkholderia edwinii]
MTDNHSKSASPVGRASRDPHVVRSLRPAHVARRAMNALYLLALPLALAPAAGFAKPPVDPEAALIAHGNYIVHRVGMCTDCHTPKDAHGQSIAAQDLQGAELHFTPDAPVPGFTNRSVRLAGLPAGYTEAQLATFLETGHTPSGGTARPPMPDYRLNEHDARAVAAYLHSLN